MTVTDSTSRRRWSSRRQSRRGHGIYSTIFRQRVKHIRIEEVVIAPRSPWQNPYVERLIGSIRRECLDHIIVLHERHLQRILTVYF